MGTLSVELVEHLAEPEVLAVPVRKPAAEGDAEPAVGVLAVDAAALSEGVADLVEPFLADVEHSGSAGTVHPLAQPLGPVRRILFVGIGEGSDRDWRTAAAAVTRAAMSKTAAAVLLPTDASPEAVAAVTEGVLLASYRYRLANKPDDSRKLETVTLVVGETQRYAAAHRDAVIVAEATCLARDLTNTPSADKAPADLAAKLVETAEAYGVSATVWQDDDLERDGFGGILAVGRGSARPPRLVELSWSPPDATRHVVLVGKGIVFDTGGVDIKPSAAMILMRKDMGGAATVAATVIGAARLNLPVRITALIPLAENMAGADSYRPGDVVSHYGGITTEVLNTDAEGRMVLADALAYAVHRLDPDLVLDLATLTGAAMVALGKRTAVLCSDNDDLARQLAEAAEQAGERVWRLPLPDDYVDLLRSDVADLNNAPGMGGEGGGAITAAMFLREFLGDHRDRWAHIDMSNTSWADGADGELAKYATGWGVRTLLRWLSTSPA